MSVDSLLPNNFTKMRRFLLIRKEDLSGVSGTGEIAEGAVFTNGLTVIRWLREPFALKVYQNLQDVIQVHGYEGRTQILFID